MLIKECLRLLEAGAEDRTIAALIAENTKIVLITRAECERLDRRPGLGLGLRQCMPRGWLFGADPFARLAAAEIEWGPIPCSTQAALATMPGESAAG